MSAPLSEQSHSRRSMFGLLGAISVFALWIFLRFASSAADIAEQTELCERLSAGVECPDGDGPRGFALIGATMQFTCAAAVTLPVLIAAFVAWLRWVHIAYRRAWELARPGHRLMAAKRAVIVCAVPGINLVASLVVMNRLACVAATLGVPAAERPAEGMPYRSPAPRESGRQRVDPMIVASWVLLVVAPAAMRFLPRPFRWDFWAECVVASVLAGGALLFVAMRSVDRALDGALARCS